MSQSIVAKRYAQALFELANQQGKLAEVGADLNELAKVTQESPEFLAVLAAPKISVDKKKEMVQSLFANAEPVLLNTLQILVDKKRINEIAAITSAFKDLAADAQGSANAVVSSTRALTADEVANISKAFAQLVGKQTLTITNEVNPSLLGGIRVQIGNHIYDSTVISKLARLENELIG
ncbi:ATP synthase subunit delta [Lysinibacillus alkalisoli]|uniref:ATP synthase subunit delta n=1 Tax=Lysinibacillus alkalisoli TaxID=1911548 RepID=A0A917D701_9BACI|nr:F0F1 ATP synthase subunit delta [Lysinibacillus alkalisoli]GGG12561.1 ATP synthase subunit delta [Lysinibacillus alkalisoli]